MSKSEIPISFIRTIIRRYEKDIDYELYDSTESDWRPIIKRDTLSDLIREWNEYCKNHI